MSTERLLPTPDFVYTKKSSILFQQGLWTLSFLPSKYDYWHDCQLNKLLDFLKDVLYVFYTLIITKIKLAGWFTWKEFQDELSPNETSTKKALFFLLFLGRGFPIFGSF